MPKGTTYVAPVWVNDSEPDLSAENLNPVMAEIESLDKAVFWNSGNTYALGDVVLYAGAAWASLQGANSGHTPGASPSWWLQLASSGTTNAWDSGRTYGLNDPCTRNGIPYRSLVATNTGNDPATAPDKWEVVGGSGQGVENFLKNALTKANTTGVTGTGLTSAAWDTSATAQKLLAAGALKAVVPSSGTRTLDIALSDLDAINVGLTWEVRFAYLIDTAGADGLVTVSLYDGTTDVATSLASLPYAGGTAQMTLGTVIPTTVLSGQRLRFTFSGSTGFNFYLTKASVGPKTAVVAPAVGPTISYVPIIGNLGAGSATTSAKYYRVGNYMHCFGTMTKDTTAGSGSSGISLSLPTGLTIDRSVANGPVEGFFSTVENPAKTGEPYVIAGVLYLRYQGNLILGSSMTAGLTLEFSFTVPIAQWSVNVNLASEFTEYAYNYSATTTDDTTSFGYGPEGAAFQGFVPTGLTYVSKHVKFMTPVQSSDMLIMEVRNPVSGKWGDVRNSPIGGCHFQNDAGTVAYGTILSTSPVDPCTCAVEFFSRAVPGPGADWAIFAANGWKWRVRKVSGGNMAEVPPVVRAEYTNSASVSNSIFNFQTKVEDTHGAVTVGASWKFTAPIDGVYLITGSVVLATANKNVQLYKNGAFHRFLVDALITGQYYYNVSVSIRLKVGEYTSLFTGDTVPAYPASHIEITRIGN